ncbi:MAG: c-type cytochrome [Candidatus Binatia bacterium]
MKSERAKAFGATCLAVTVFGCGLVGRDWRLWPSEPETSEVKLCDGETSTRVPARLERTPENGQKIADALMSQWRRKHPDADWVEKERDKHMIVPPADNRKLVGKPQGHTYGQITDQDVLTWERETVKLVVEGSRVFHSGDELGSAIAVSCDMCHPDAANTHPETYPKFQVQLGRVVLLRDMINWCIEHPVRGQPLAPDDPKMRALEAYVLAQRKGKTLNYGQR